MATIPRQYPTPSATTSAPDRDAEPATSDGGPDPSVEPQDTTPVGGPGSGPESGVGGPDAT